MKKLLIGLALVLLGGLVQAQYKEVWYTAAIVEEDNMISNGAFASASDWDFSAAGWSYSSNAALYTDGAGSGSLIQVDGDMNTSIAAITNYRLAFDIDGTGTANISIQNSDAAITYIGGDNYTVDSYILYFKSVADIGVGGIAFYTSDGSTDADFTIDDIELTERTLGTEIITNGTFTTDVSWVKGTAWDINSTVAGEAYYAYNASSDLEQTDAVMAGSMAAGTYRLFFEISNASGLAGFDVECYGGGTVYYSEGANQYANGTYNIDFTITSVGNGGIRFDTSSSGSTSTFSIDNVSLKKYQTD